MNEADLKTIYLNKISESIERLNACESFLRVFHDSQSVSVLEAAVLQMRKALECVAYAAIAPNKKEYSEFRAKAQEQPDYTKDYHAGRIMRSLSKINPKFYPMPISEPISSGRGKWHFDRRNDDSLTKSRFESLYDRLGKYLHADNPWGYDKGVANLLADIPGVISSVRLLLSWHVTFIRTPDFNGAWVIEAPQNGDAPRVIVGLADGDFQVE